MTPHTNARLNAHLLGLLGLADLIRHVITLAAFKDILRHTRGAGHASFQGTT